MAEPTKEDWKRAHAWVNSAAASIRRNPGPEPYDVTCYARALADERARIVAWLLDRSVTAEGFVKELEQHVNLGPTALAGVNALREAAEALEADETETCGCDEPDGTCEGCDDEHGHTCIACDQDWCQACWEGGAHLETCGYEQREVTIADYKRPCSPLPDTPKADHERARAWAREHVDMRATGPAGNAAVAYLERDAATMRQAAEIASGIRENNELRAEVTRLKRERVAYADLAPELPEGAEWDPDRKEVHFPGRVSEWAGQRHRSPEGWGMVWLNEDEGVAPVGALMISEDRPGENYMGCQAISDYEFRVLLWLAARSTLLTTPTGDTDE